MYTLIRVTKGGTGDTPPPPPQNRFLSHIILGIFVWT